MISLATFHTGFMTFAHNLTMAEFLTFEAPQGVRYVCLNLDPELPNIDALG